MVIKLFIYFLFFNNNLKALFWGGERNEKGGGKKSIFTFPPSPILTKMSIIKTVLLNALPAAGKSEVRALLKAEPELCKELMIGDQVQLDDFPYVKFMRDIDDVLSKLGYPRFFFERPDLGFRSGVEWGVLALLLNEDYHDLVVRAQLTAEIQHNAARWLLQRYDRARAKLEIPSLLGDLPAKAIWSLEAAIEKDAREFAHAKYSSIPASLEGKTVFIEFSRGGAHGSKFPLPPPYGYQYTWSLLSPEILSGAAVLYIYITPEQSRAKNTARGKESTSTSSTSTEAGKYVLSLNHSVPDYVMFNEYGCDDVHYLLTKGNTPLGCVDVLHVSQQTFAVPVAIFDNREDYTTFCRGDPKDWSPENKTALRNQLKKTFADLCPRYSAIHH